MTTYTPCGCGCRPEGLQPGCGCPECQPGAGIDYRARRERSAAGSEARMMLLLHRETLTDSETVELDGLLDWYIHRR